MARNSADFLHQTNSNTFIVSRTGTEGIIDSYWGGGHVQVTVSVFAATPTILKDFPYDFRIIEANFTTRSFGKAAHNISLFKGGTTISSTPISNCVAGNFIATFACTASRTRSVTNTTLNFNNVNISKNHRLYLMASGASYANMNGTLTLRVIPV